MNKLPATYKELISNIVGSALMEVNGLIYVFETPDLEHPQQLQLIFSDNSGDIGFRCGKDGVTLELTKLPMQESDLGEYGKEIIMSISTSLLFRQYIGMVVSKIFLIYSNIEETTIGIKIVFKYDINLIIVNIGDEISICEKLPTQFEKDEGLSYFNMINTSNL